MTNDGEQYTATVADLSLSSEGGPFMNEARTSRIVRAAPGRITQGTVFRCACSDSYTDCDVLGIVITARCDLANAKVASHTYLPLVPLRAWLRRDFVSILQNRVVPDLLGQFRKALTEAGHSTSILASQSPRNILDRIILPDNSRDGAKRFKSFTSIVEKYEKITDQNLIECRDAPTSLTATFQSESKKILQELVRQTLAGYYYFCEVESDQESEPHVALLREIQSAPSALMQRLAQGLERSEYEDLCEKHRGWRERLRFRESDFAAPLGTLRSPDVEHLVQNFSTLFARVGIADPPGGEVESIQSRFLRE